jgi:uncharacterized protein YbaA (DUF1428 family)
MAAKVAPIFKEYGALQHVEAQGDDIPDVPGWAVAASYRKFGMISWVNTFM